VPVIIILIVVVLVVIVAGLVTWVWRGRSAGRLVGAPAGEREAVFHGGIMSKTLTTSGLLVKFEFFDWGVRISGIAPSRWVIPTWEARYDELAMAELVASPFSRVAVWLRLRGESGGMGFLSQHSEQILRMLGQQEVPVNRAVTRIKRVEDLYEASR
jgi:hypothetical protein